MKLFHIGLTLASTSLLFAAPARAMPENPTELRELVESRYDGDPLSYVSDKGGDFRRMICRNRADLVGELLDLGLAPGDVRAFDLYRATQCAFREEQYDIVDQVLDPDALTVIDFWSSTRVEPLLQDAVESNSYDQTLVLLNNGAALYRSSFVERPRQVNLLLAAADAIDMGWQNSLRAMDDAGFGEVIALARSEQCLALVRGENGGGGLLRGLASMAAGAALGDTQGAVLGVMGAQRALSGDDDADQRLTCPEIAKIESAPQEQLLLGIQFDNVAEPERAIEIQEIQGGGLADQAGLRRGDVVRRIADFRVRGWASTRRALRTAADQEEFAVEYLRGGEQRSAIIVNPLTKEPEHAETVAQSAASKTTGAASVTNTSSMIEELERLGELKAKGLITEEEFETLKARVLEGQ